MGALHAGHCSLINQSIKENDKTVVSIFVNPSQFAPHEDLDNYPRTLDHDLQILQTNNNNNNNNNKIVDAVFVPKVSEMYPSGISLDIGKQRGAFVTVHGSSEQLEGITRPQFFRCSYRGNKIIKYCSTNKYLFWSKRCSTMCCYTKFSQRFNNKY